MPNEQMDELAAEIRQRIQLNGPLNLARYMSICLSHSEHGYYMSRDPLGALGDFTTAPEISQIFGEIIGLWTAYVWQALGAPARLHLVELGPGRGTLMADALRAIRAAAPRCMAALDVHLVETSPLLRQKQAAALQACGLPPHWHNKVDHVPAGPAVFLANEFFDALPIHQYQRVGTGWRERLVTIAGKDGGEDGFKTGLSAVPAKESYLPDAYHNAPHGAIAEISPARDGVMKTIARRLSRQAGAALIIDYGHLKTAPGDTFQAVRAHQYADPFKHPGKTDLTSHVDFEQLARIADKAGAAAHPPMTQGAFLRALGIEARAAMLRQHTGGDSTEANQAIDADVQRLTGDDAMGALFKVLCVTSPTPEPPAPFAPSSG